MLLHVLVKVGMLPADKPCGQKSTCYPVTFGSLGMLSGMGGASSSEGLRECRERHRGSFFLALALAGQALSSLDVLPSVLWWVLSIPGLGPA